MFGQNIVVHTDHMNILHANLTNDRTIRWRGLLEEHGAKFVHIRGVDNVVATALSRLDKEDQDVKIPEEKSMVMCSTRLDHDEGLADVQHRHCFASIMDEELERFPMSPQLISKQGTTKAHKL